MSTTYTIGGGGLGYASSSGQITLGPSTQGPSSLQTLTLKITPANGGTIISVGTYTNEDNLYVIADDADFDRELGKIITLSRLKD